MSKPLTEDEVRAFTRDEWNRLERERQSRCAHKRSGTLRPDGELHCDQCDKPITVDDVHYDDSFSSIEQRAIDNTRGWEEVD